MLDLRKTLPMIDRAAKELERDGGRYYTGYVLRQLERRTDRAFDPLDACVTLCILNQLILDEFAGLVAQVKASGTIVELKRRNLSHSPHDDADFRRLDGGPEWPDEKESEYEPKEQRTQETDEALPQTGDG